MNMRLTKAERLSGKKDMARLFEKGNKLFSYPYRVVWRFSDDENQQLPVQILVSVSKRNFKKAVDRNQIKRYIRESYRKNKMILWDELEDKKIIVAVLYIEKDIKDYSFFAKSMEKMLRNLKRKIE